MLRLFDNTKITVEFDEAGNRQQLSSGDSLKTLFGKIRKWFSDLKPVAFSGSYNDLSDTPETTEVPTGFDHRDNSLAWGTQEGEYVTAWNAGNNCSVGFRKNCPTNGKASMILDGTVYVDEGKYPVVSHDDTYNTINNIVLVGNSDPPITKPWHKVAELELNVYDKCVDENITLLISTEFIYNTTSGQPYCGILRVTTRVNENVQFEHGNIKWILLDKKTDYENEWILLHNNETPCKFELWTKVEDPWMFLTIRLLSSSNRSSLKNKWKLLTSYYNGSESYTEGMTVIRQTYSELVGNISSATKLATARTITIGNKSNTFNGTGNISFNLSDIGALYDNCSKSGAITINGIKFYTVMNGSTFKVVDAENICCSNGYLKVINSTGGYNGIYASQFSTQSSRRVKTNITPMTETEARKILDVDVVGYDYINGAKDQYGMIAEDVYNVIPSIVSGNVDCDDDDIEAVSRIGIDYSKAVPYLIKLVQVMEQNDRKKDERMEMMEGEIRELKKELKMRDRIDE